MSLSLETSEIWSEYLENRSQVLRNELIEVYWPLVRRMAYKLFNSLGRVVPVDDLIAYGSLGLIDALERFDPSKTTEFEGYAFIRIRGSMIDELRNLDWVPRSVKILGKRVDQAKDELRAELLREPTSDEIATNLGMSEEEFATVIVQITGNRILSLDAPVQEGEATSFVDLVEDKSSYVEESTGGVSLDPFLEKLDGRERLIMSLTYNHSLSFADISALLGFGESRVSQIHSQALSLLREIVKES